MNKREIIRLRSLVKRLKKESLKRDRQSERLRTVSGDEAFHDVIQLTGEAIGIDTAADNLERLINTLELTAKP